MSGPPRRLDEMDPDDDVDIVDSEEGDDEDQEMDDRNPFGTAQLHTSGQHSGNYFADGNHQANKRRSTLFIEGADDYEDDDGRYGHDSDEEDDGSGGNPFAAFGSGDVDDEDDEQAEFMVMEEEEVEDPVEAFRREILQAKQAIQYEEWETLTNREQASGLIEPTSLGELDIPEDFMFYAQVYSVVQAILSGLMPYGLLLFEGHESTQSIGAVLFALTVIGAVVDIIARIVTYLPKRSKAGMVFDGIVCLSALISLIDTSILGGVVVFIALFRGVRFLRFIYLFRDHEMFRQLFLVQKTISDSIAVLMVVLLLAAIGVFIASTFLWAFETSFFDYTRGIWMRECTADVACMSEVAQLQSISGAMWLAMNCITLTGYGDTFPVTAPGRIIAGVTSIAGVLAIALPSTILTGNLISVRFLFARERKIREDRIVAEAIDRVTEKALARLDHNVATAQADGPSGGRATAGTVFSDPMGGTGLDSTIPQMAGSGLDASLFIQDRLATQLPRMQQSGEFYFMSAHPRRVTLSSNGEYLYNPIMKILHAEDGFVLTGNVTTVDSSTMAMTVFLVLDDPVAQELAAQCVLQEGEISGCIAHAKPVSSLQVTMSGHPAMSLLPVQDVGNIQSNVVPLIIVVTQTNRFGGLTNIRKAMTNTQFEIQYAATAATSAVWRENMYVGADLLRSTAFVQKLRKQSVMIAPNFFLNQEELDPESEMLKRRRNIAFIRREDIAPMLGDVLEAMSSVEDVIVRNQQEVLNGVVQLIVLHSREMYFRDIPTMIHSAVWKLTDVRMFDKLLEIDVAIFSGGEWPLGSVAVEFGCKPKATVVEVNVDSDSLRGSLPSTSNVESLKMEYDLQAEDADDEETPEDFTEM